ncbi:MAG: glycosyltransferase [Actinomycetota bacterium]
MMAVHVVIPAHNEAERIVDAVYSLRLQTTPVSSITVIADNCTDETASLARRLGVDVIEPGGNPHRKAGALNQFLARYLYECDYNDFVLVMDADTRLVPTFVERAVELLSADPYLGAVGGIFVADAPRGWLELCQANEYTRYARDVARHRGRVRVLTGTATIFRVRALREVQLNRGDTLPGLRGQVYDVQALTEDNEITLALKHLGWRMVSPKGCLAWTEVMPTTGALHRQRLRWYRGAIDNLRAYGLTKTTLPYWGQQAMLGLSISMFALLLMLTGLSIMLGSFAFSLGWSLVGLGFLLERVVSSWRTKYRPARLVSLLVLPELWYDLILQATFLRAMWHSVRRHPADWHHDTGQPPSAQGRFDAAVLPVIQAIPQQAVTLSELPPAQSTSDAQAALLP